MALAGKKDEVEALVGLDQGIQQPDRIARMDIAVDIAGATTADGP